MFDFYFFYNYIGRYILILKQNELFLHYTKISKINNLIIYFDIKELMDMSSISILNYIYFFKYYFGFLPYFSNYKYKFKLNNSFFSFVYNIKYLKNNYIFLYYFLL
jgi:hypothetical protein